MGTLVNTELVWKAPPLRLYSSPAPVGLVTVIIALPAPKEQSTVCTGTDGVAGWGSIVKLDDVVEVHPCSFVMVNDHVPAGIPVAVCVEPLPVVVDPPGRRISVHVPVAGNPLSATLPVASEHVGWVMAPMTGAVGTGGGRLTTALDDDGEVHPDELVTVNV